MTLHRFFLPPDSFEPGCVTFPAGASRQIARVLRLRAGETVIALDGMGMEYVVRLDVLAPSTEGTILEGRRNVSETPRPIVLFQALLKGSKFETVLQRCTEVGASRFVPVITARSIPAEPSASRRRRFEAIIREAAEQSGRGVLPHVDEPVDLSTALNLAINSGPAVFLYEEERNDHLDRIPLSGQAMTVGLFVGPEGGFDATEVQAARRAGLYVAGLGPRILRAETAAIVGTAILAARFERGP